MLTEFIGGGSIRRKVHSIWWQSFHCSCCYKLRADGTLFGDNWSTRGTCTRKIGQTSWFREKDWTSH
jgi:hypothetical protein